MRHLTLLAAALVASAMAGEAGAYCLDPHPSGPDFGAVVGSNGAYHPNGGGWVADTATVADSAYVGPGGSVCENATVSDTARLTGARAYVTDNARVSGHAVIEYVAHIFDNAQISGHAVVADHVGGNARVYGSAVIRTDHTNNAVRIVGNAEVFGTAIIGDNVWITGNGKVDCGRWENIRVTTDRTGECGLNGNQPRRPRVNDLLGTLDPGNTQSPDIQQWGDGALLSNPLDPGATGLGE